MKLDLMYWKLAIWKLTHGIFATAAAGYMGATVTVKWSSMGLDERLQVCLLIGLGVGKFCDGFFDSTVSRLATGKPPVLVNGNGNGPGHETANTDGQGKDATMMTVGKVTTAVMVAALIGVGCASFGNRPAAERLGSLAKVAAFTGTRVYLAEHPEQRPIFVKVHEALQGLEAGGTFDAAALALVLQSLPINELQGPEGSLYVSAAVVLWDEVIGGATAIDQVAVVRAVLPKVREGLALGLGPEQRSEVRGRRAETKDVRTFG